MGQTAQITLNYTPHAKQLAFHKSNAKFRALLTGIGFGKTVAGAVETLKSAIQHPTSLHVIIAPNTKIMQNATLPEFYKYARPFILKEIKSKNLIYLHNGACIIYLTADNARHIERLRGLTIGFFWMDEARLLLRSIWRIIIGRLRAKDGPLKGIFTTTTNGRDWLYYLFHLNKDPYTHKPVSNPEDFWWTGGSTFDNPYTPEEYKKNLLASYSGRYAKQELYGGIVGFEGQVYSNFDHGTHESDKEPDKKKIKEVIYAVDWGFSNPMASLIIAIDNDGRAYVLQEFYESQVQVNTVISWVKEQKQTYNVSVGYGDPAEPQFIQQFNEAGMNMYPADNAVMPGIEEVFKRFAKAADGKPRLFIHKRCKRTLEEIDTYRFKEVQEDKPKKDEPLKVNDHLMDALRYAVKTHMFDAPGYIILDDPTGNIL